nr:hypothetical protein [Neobacillus sp. Marseille-Q6967]
MKKLFETLFWRLPMKKLFEPIAIIGRFAFGVTCLERICEEWQVKSQQMNELIEILWTLTSTKDVCDWWEFQVSEIVWDIEDNKNETPAKFGFEFLQKDKQETLTEIIVNVCWIAGNNLFSAFRSEHSMVYTLRVASLLKANNVELPDLKPFQKSKVTEYQGWGNSVDKSFFKN